MAAAAAEIVFGEPVVLEWDEAEVALGAENRDGQQLVVLTLDGAGCDSEGRGYAFVAMSPEQASVLADALAGLARVGS
jgi:hypothetical protein